MNSFTSIDAGAVQSLTRRNLIRDLGRSFAGMALGSILSQDGLLPQPAPLAAAEGQSERPTTLNPLAPRTSHFPARVKSVIYLFMYGGPSQVDSWDYKPELQKRSGQKIDIETRRRRVTQATLLGSKRTFRQYGQSGLWGSDAFPRINRQLDHICLVKSLYADTFAHASALIQLNSGRVVQGHPSLGSWLCYGLGSENEQLPGYIVMLDPRGGPIAGAANWSSGFMPASYQGTHLRNKGQPILDLQSSQKTSRSQQREFLDTLQLLNNEHQAQRHGYSELAARIASYELAFQLQMSAPEAMDVTRETAATQRMYGIGLKPPAGSKSMGPSHFGTQCLIARRLVERGVRYIQIYSGGGHSDQNWDAHGDVELNLSIHAPEIDQPIAALLTDLKQRGMLDETLVVWGGEFGRQAVAENGKGRDHNPLGFLYWLAGGGIRGGTSHGETDELGHRAVVDRHHVRDLHATILHQTGMDHRKLTYTYGGLDQRLTGVQPARVIQEILS